MTGPAVILDFQAQRERRAVRGSQQLSRAVFAAALATWHDSVRLWALQCALVGVPVPPEFLAVCGRIKQAVERRYSLPR
jgi:hypothetical protein